MIDKSLDNYIQAGYNNKKTLMEEGLFSCYFCFKKGYTIEIEDWVDKGKTALCPHCLMDTLVPGHLDNKLLEKITNHAFKPIKD